MQKTNILTLIVVLFLVCGCYKKGSTENSRTSQIPANSAPTAEKTVESAANNQPSKSGDFNAAMDFYRAKDYEKAATEFEQIVTADAKNQKAHFNLGKSYQALNKTDQAVGAYQKAIAIKPDDAEANFALGSIYLKKKDFEKSLPFIKQAAKINYKSAEYLVALGDNYRELNQCNYAIPPYGNSLGFDGKNTAAYYGMGLCYIELKNRIAAGQQVRNLEQLDKDLAKKLEAQIPK